MIGVQNQQVIDVVDDTLTYRVEFSNNVHIRPCCALGFEPRLTEEYILEEARLLFFDNENLEESVTTRRV
jgi:hypothetical protein